MPQTRLAALVVTHNRLDKLRLTLSRLLEAPAAQLAHLVVVDNASTDGTGAWLAGLDDPRLTVLRLTENSGGAGGFRAGLADVRDRLDPDWVVLMDDDARPEPGALAAFHATDRSGQEAWAAAVRYPDGRLCEMNRPWVNPFWHWDTFWRTARRGRAAFHLPEAAFAGTAPVAIDGGSFVGLFLSRRALSLAALPQAALFVYGDDVLYTLDLSAKGGRIAFDPRLRWEHDCATFDPEARLTPLWKVYYYHRNLILVYRRAAGPLFFWPAFALIWPRWRARARAYGPEAAAYRRILSRAVRDGLARRLTRPHDEVQRL